MSPRLARTELILPLHSPAVLPEPEHGTSSSKGRWPSRGCEGRGQGQAVVWSPCAVHGFSVPVDGTFSSAEEGRMWFILPSVWGRKKPKLLR